MTDTPKMVFVTKYALSDGIVEVVPERLGPDGYATIRMPKAAFPQTFSRLDWHTTREAAVSRANAMRDAKLQALQQQAERVKGLRFE